MRFRDRMMALIMRLEDSTDADYSDQVRLRIERRLLEYDEIFAAVIKSTEHQYERYEDEWWFKAIQERLQSNTGKGLSKAEKRVNRFWIKNVSHWTNKLKG